MTYIDKASYESPPPCTHAQIFCTCIKLVQMQACVHTCKDTAIYCNTLQHAASHCNALQRAVTHCNIQCNMHSQKRLTVGNDVSVQYTATHCNTLHHMLQHTLQHTFTDCQQRHLTATLQHTASYIATRTTTHIR